MSTKQLLTFEIYILTCSCSSCRGAGSCSDAVKPWSCSESCSSFSVTVQPCIVTLQQEEPAFDDLTTLEHGQRVQRGLPRKEITDAHTTDKNAARDANHTTHLTRTWTLTITPWESNMLCEYRMKDVRETMWTLKPFL